MTGTSNEKRRCEHGFKSPRYCNACERERARLRRRAFKERRREIGDGPGFESLSRDRKYFIKRKYGLDESAFRALLDGQRWACRICDVRLTFAGPRETTPHIDHDHRTGRIRGVLCQYCNSALGYLRDNAGRARRAADYLEGRP